jgi:plastocyanin
VVFTNGGGNKTLIKKQGAVLLRMTFSRPGRYSYFCTAHQSFGMTGTVVVTRK